MNLKTLKYSEVWCSQMFFLLCLMGTVHSHLSSGHSQHFGKPLDIFFYEVIPTKPISIESVENIEKNMTCPSLEVDESCIVIESNIEKTVKFQYQSVECEDCSFFENHALKPFESQSKVIEFVSLGTLWKVSDENNKTLCNVKEVYLGERSRYHLTINDTGCTMICTREPDNVYIPLLYAVGIYALIAIMWIFYCYIKRTELFHNLFQQDSLDNLAAAYSSSTTVEESKSKPPSRRLLSLDVVRGISLVLMIFVNFGAGKYYFFDHAHWNGLMVADFVFPWFIWMLGLSMAISMRNDLRKSVPRKKIFLHIVRRSAIFFLLGLMLNTSGTSKSVYLPDLRISGVLQRFAVSYFVVATVHLFYASANDDADSYSRFRDIKPYGGEWLIMLTILTIHLVLSFLVHAPDCPRGYFGPGGLHHQGAYADCTGGAAGYIDRMLLGKSHLYQRPTFKNIYHSTLPYDPEGILGYLTSIFLVFLGLQAGKIVLLYKDTTNRIVRWMSWSVILAVLALILCKASKNDGWIPINKNLWSVSYIFATGSTAFALMSIIYFICDVKKWWSGAPFYHAGRNSIVLYCGHMVAHHMFPFSWQVSSTHINLLFMSLWAPTLWTIIAIWLYLKESFIAV